MIPILPGDLAQLAYELGVESPDLDEAIHELFAAQAADVNNGGLDRQIEVLLANLGAQEVENLLTRVAQERGR